MRLARRAAWCMLLLAGMLGADAKAPEPAAKLLAGFEPGADGLIHGAGAVVKEHASQGEHSYKVTSQDGKFAGIDIVDGGPLRAFKDYILFKVDVFNPQDRVVRMNARIDDTASKDYGSRYNDDSLVAPPGRSTVSINLTGITRTNARNFAEREKMDIAKLRQVSLFFATKEATTLYFDNVRLEGSGLPAVEGLRAFDFGPAKSPVFPGFEGCDAATVFDEARGFGWINPGQSDNVYMPDDLTGDWANGQEFRAKLPNGKYQVHLCIDHYGIWMTAPHFRNRTLTINGQQVLSETQTGKDFFEQRYLAQEDQEDLPGQDWWEKFIAPRNIIRHYDVEVTDGALHVRLAADGGYGNGISFLVVYPEAKKPEGDAWMKTLQAKRKQHFNETLVVRVQEGIPTQARAINLTGGGMAAFIRSSDRDLPVNAVPTAADPEEATFEATPGERAHAILGLMAMKEMKGVNVTVSQLETDKERTLPGSTIELRKIRNFLKRSGFSRMGTIEPRILADFKTVDLTPKRTVGVWLTARVPESAEAGTYKGTITVAAGAEKVVVPVTLTVLPFKLDRVTDMTLSVTGATAGHWRGWFQDLDERWWQNAEVVMKNMADHGMNAVTGGPGATLIGVKDGKAQIDYADMDRWLSLAVKHGLTMPGDAYQGLTIKGLPWSQKGDMLASMEADAQKRFGMSYKELVRIVFADVEKHAKEKGWPKRVYSYLDEPRPEFGNVESAGEWIKLVTEASPGTLFAGYYSSGAGRDGYFDRLPVSIAHLDSVALERTKKAGRELWDYDGGGARHNIGRWAFVAHRAGLKGYLRNGYMYVCSDPYFDFSDDEASWCVVYPSKNGVNDTVGWERTSDGVTDYRYLATLSRLIEEARQKGVAKPQVDAAATYLEGTLKPIDLFDRKTADLDAEGFREFRRTLARHITALKQATAP